jgi:signal transduction histidine kinase
MAGLLFIALLLGHFVADSLPRSATDLADRGIFILVIAIVALLVWEIRQSYASLKEEIVERRTAQEQLEALAGTLEARVAERTAELSKVNYQLTCDIAERNRIEAALAMANQKLLLLSQITRHDISNRVFALLVNLELAKEQVAILKDPEIEENILSMEKNIAGIQAQVAFAKDYQEIGAQTPKWHPVDAVIRAAAEQLNLGDTAVEINTGSAEVFADPMIGRVFYNLIDNALRHGGRVTRITFSCTVAGSSLVIRCADDGIGIPDWDKQHIFTKGFGRDSGLGLFLIQEILAITGITIRECGRYGEGACFALQVPEGQFRMGTGSTA